MRSRLGYGPLVVGCVLAAAALTAVPATASPNSAASLTYTAGDGTGRVDGHAYGSGQAPPVVFSDTQSGATITCNSARLDGYLGSVGSGQSKVDMDFDQDSHGYFMAATDCHDAAGDPVDVRLPRGPHVVINPVAVPSGLQAVLELAGVTFRSPDADCSFRVGATEVPGTYLNAHSALRFRGSLGRVRKDGSSCFGFQVSDAVRLADTVRLRALGHDPVDNPISITLDPAAG